MLQRFELNRLFCRLIVDAIKPFLFAVASEDASLSVTSFILDLFVGTIRYNFTCLIVGFVFAISRPVSLNEISKSVIIGLIGLLVFMAFIGSVLRVSKYDVVLFFFCVEWRGGGPSRWLNNPFRRVWPRSVRRDTWSSLHMSCPQCRPLCEQMLKDCSRAGFGCALEVCCSAWNILQQLLRIYFGTIILRYLNFVYILV